MLVLLTMISGLSCAGMIYLYVHWFFNYVDIFKELNVRLPPITIFVYEVSAFMKDNFIISLVIALGLVASPLLFSGENKSNGAVVSQIVVAVLFVVMSLICYLSVYTVANDIYRVTGVNILS